MDAVLLTPELARSWLAGVGWSEAMMTSYRGEYAALVDRFADDIRAGRFSDGSTVNFEDLPDRPGPQPCLVDGYKRCLAVIATGVAIKVRVLAAARGEGQVHVEVVRPEPPFAP